MKKIKKILIILLPLTLCILLLSANKVEAMTSEEAGRHIANYAINFWQGHSSETIYTCWKQRGDWEECRARAYNLEKTDGYYMMDCAGFANLVVHQSTGLSLENYGHDPAGCAFAAQNGCWNPPYEEVSMSNLLPGDLLTNYHHTMIYVGDGKIVHCDGGNANSDTNGRRYIISNNGKL